MSNEDNGILPPPTDPSALKSILNPIHSEGATPSSTVPEPPKSPQPEPAAMTITTESAPVENQSTPAPPPIGESTLPSNGDTSLPPLPIDAPVPPSPKAADEPPPTLPEGAIPPAVSTPSVITDGLATPALEIAQPTVASEPSVAPATVEPIPESTLAPTPAPEVPAQASVTPHPEPSAPAPAQASELAPPPPPPASQLETAPAPNESAPSGVIEPAPTPAESAPAPATSTSQLPTVPPSDAMDIDQPEPSPAASLKRAGDDLEGREEKRTRDEAVAEAAPPAAEPVPAAQAPAPAPAPTPAPAQVPGLIGTVPVVVPPPPVAAGPTTPLTLTQHKHMLSCVRSLKKNKDAVYFLEPVDPIRFGIPHYPDIITKPMDLGTVETKLIVSDPRGPPKDKSKMGKWDQSKGKYNSVSDVVLDIRQIFWNTSRFNGSEHMVTQSALRLDGVLAKMLNNMPAEVSLQLIGKIVELTYQPVFAAPAAPSPAAGPSSHARRPSVSHPPAIRRTSETTDRPKREIHPPPSKDLAYADAPRKPKRRSDPQLQWALKTIKAFESTNKTYDIVSPFLFPVESLLTTFADYASVIKKPIDLHIIKQRLTDGEYDDISQVDGDMRLMFANALKYNAAQDPVAIAANQFQQLWTEKLRSVPPKYVSRDSSEDPIGGDIEYDSEDEHGEFYSSTYMFAF
jgi:bromodomain-containing factor 1